jgi:diguanylate cyclase (GGDEF)-like protein
VAGQLDLRAFQPDEGSVPLAGEWALRWQQLEEGGTASDCGPPGGPYIPVPGAWNGQPATEGPLPGLGYATHALRVRLPDGPLPPLALAIGEAHSAERWFVNGRVALDRGRVGRTRAEEWADPRPRLLELPVSSSPCLELLVQVSNHFHFEGGLIHAPRLGATARLRADEEREGRIDFLLFGAFGVVTLYYAALFLSRPERSYLWFALVTLLVGVRTATLKWYLNDLLPLGAAGQLRLDYLTLFFAPAAFLAFLAELFPGDVPRRVVRTFLGLSLLNAVLVMLAPTTAFTQARSLAMVLALVQAALAVSFVSRAALRGREGGRLLAAACLLVLVLGTHDALSRQRLIAERREFLPFANAVLILVHAVVLGRRLSGALRESLDKSESLRELNLGLEERIAERTVELERLATTDPLTGLFNRRHLLVLAEAERARARRHGHDLAVMVIDADHFKEVNDRHGHEAGDAVLRFVAQELLHLVRAHDLAGRWGGEEFVLVLPHLDRESARAAAERFRQGLGGPPIALPAGDEIRITVSIGVAVAHRDESFEDALRRADRALYVAKTGGRNRVEMAAP